MESAHRYFRIGAPLILEWTHQSTGICIDYLVEPKSIGKYQLDTENFFLTARKGDMDITINIDNNRKIFLALYPGDIEIDENGNVVDTSKKLTDEQKEHMDDLLINRKEEILPIINRALELWDSINN